MALLRTGLACIALLLLGGCLATFDAPLTGGEKAPPGLLGHWVARDAWGEHVNLEIRKVGERQYRAVSSGAGQGPREEAVFRVSHHGERWYATTVLPAAFGGRRALVGFELNEQGELVVYNLSVDEIKQAIAGGELAGQPFSNEQGDGVAVSSSAQQVFAWLDDPAHSDAFNEIARYRRDSRN
ncbi:MULTISPECIES: hypothetical protein [unclassified Pseudomonas]|uniref:hypothetical protein n=1 Tax=unclassified Pseudomonas TaxID=196821 RepID=UPI000BD09B9A|nr:MULTISPECIES: hypothetical protein [unclassified Pseudomonas]PVZ16133.1 hypothetical protein F474_01636 [Pseudomonas sp. URIL14HWK12:I12]PVZ26011.1 hypothetical protein F470_01474 [Pseudomonas sp. URIL14HWK12:I10]PVZ36465.1 hypothetical protein F472_01636 [Pseudomonas sp. URIL14HWK12:I11]SNZ18527.1 hypothetical protein SAMN05660463_04100 [Pseudomonas sp. URIL14HWK12:I9]